MVGVWAPIGWFISGKCPPPGRLLLACVGKVREALQGKQEAKTSGLKQITGLSRLWFHQSVPVGQMCKSQVYGSEKHGQYTKLKHLRWLSHEGSGQCFVTFQALWSGRQTRRRSELMLSKQASQQTQAHLTLHKYAQKEK